MKKKKGFTLIEIIICISLITIIGVSMTIVIVKNNKKKEITLLEKYSSKFENALQVYLSNHEEITYNLENNAKAAAITLEVLKNEGLIDKNMGIDYKNNYFLLSNAKLLEDKTDDNADCDNDVVGVEVFTRWDLEKNKEGKKVMYVCPKSSGDSSDSEKDLIIDKLQKRISALEKSTGNTEFIFKGSNPNNWVYFNVNSVEETDGAPDRVYFPNNDKKNKWRIYNYYGSDGSLNNIKLVYSQEVVINKNYLDLMYQDLNYSFINVDDNQKLVANSYQRITNCTYSGPKVIGNYTNSLLKADNQFYIYEYRSKWTNWYKPLSNVNSYFPNTPDVICTYETENSFYNKNITLTENNEYKSIIYNRIVNKDWIESTNYVYEYRNYDHIYTVNPTYSDIKNNIGTLNVDEFKNTIDKSTRQTWLNYYNNVILGTTNSFRSGNYYVFASSSSSTNVSVNRIRDYNELSSFIPVITLKVGTKIVDNPSCNNDGSENCPYMLEYEESNTDN